MARSPPLIYSEMCASHTRRSAAIRMFESLPAPARKPGRQKASAFGNVHGTEQNWNQRVATDRCGVVGYFDCAVEPRLPCPVAASCFRMASRRDFLLCRASSVSSVEMVISSVSCLRAASLNSLSLAMCAMVAAPYSCHNRLHSSQAGCITIPA